MNGQTGEHTRSTTGIIASPGFITALILLLVNDHLLKHQFPGLITGKLSDFSGLFIVGLLTTSLWRTRAFLSLTLVALLFVWWKSPFSTTFIAAWNELTPWPLQRVIDYTDLIALLSLPAAHYYRRCHRTLALSRLLRIPLYAATLFGITATSMITRNISLSVPDQASANVMTRAEDQQFCGVVMLRDIDEVLREKGFSQYDRYSCSGTVSCKGKEVMHHGSYRWGDKGLYLYVDYDATTQSAHFVTEEGDSNYYFQPDSEVLRRSLRDALIEKGYFPLEGGMVVREPPTSFIRMTLTQAPDADPMTSSFEYDFRRLSFKTGEILKRLGFTPVAYPDCGNNAYFSPEQICAQYQAAHKDEAGNVLAQTGVSLVGYMVHGQPPIELSIVQFGVNAPYEAPSLAKILQVELGKAIPEITISVVYENASRSRL